MNKWGLKVFLLLLVFFFLASAFIFHKRQNLPLGKKSPAKQSSNVLGERSPQVVISSVGGYGSGGMIAQATTDEPAVSLSGQDISGLVEIKVYEATEQALLSYLTHNKDGQQIHLKTNTQGFRAIKTLKEDIKSSGKTKVLLPIGDSGIYYIQAKNGDAQDSVFIIRSTIGTLAKQGDNQFIFWTQNFKNKRSVSDGTVSVYNLENAVFKLSDVSINDSGIAESPISANADIAITKSNGSIAVVPLNLRYLNAGTYSSYQPKPRETRYFIYTDRPLYSPGDLIYFKSILRDDDDARYTIPIGLAKVQMFSGYSDDDLVFERNYPISSFGTVFGEFRLPEDAKTGYYRLVVSIPGSTTGTNSFQVEYFRKPEYFIDVNVPKTELVSGDISAFTISGDYFSGQPLSGAEVKYTIYSGNYYDYEYLTELRYGLDDDYRYGYWGGDIVTSGTVKLNKNGDATVKFDAVIPPSKGRSQVYSIEAQIDNGSGNPAFSRKNVLVFAGEYDIFRTDNTDYSVREKTPVHLDVRLVSHLKTPVSDISLTAKIHRENWVSYQEKDKKYPSYKKEEEDLPAIDARTDKNGNATFTFTPTKVGSYTINISGADKRKNTISKAFYVYVYSDTETYYSSDSKNDLVIRASKKEYAPTDTAEFTITSSVPNRDVFLALERGRVNRYQIVEMSGKQATVSVPLVATDMPNIYANVSSFSDTTLDTGTLDVIVSTESKKISVSVKPDRKKYGAGDTVSVDVETTDSSGIPLSADVGLWAVDKALFELVDENSQTIFDTFWAERYDETQESHSLEGITSYGAEQGGCFAAGTRVAMADGSTKAIEDIRMGDLVLTRNSERDTELVKGKVTGVHTLSVSGYLIFNGKIKVTPNHKLFVNKKWMEANMVAIGDTFTGMNGEVVSVSSVEYLSGKYDVYNLSIEKYKTYFADGIWVHNQKGESRTVFEDTAYWNPSIQTDSNGRARVVFTLPDNLTTWVIAAVGSTVDTKAGQAKEEIIVSKDVVVRPIVPNILRAGDTIILSALVQNFTQKDQTFDVGLSFDAGVVETASQSGILIKSNETKQVFWNVKPRTVTESSTLTFDATSTAESAATDRVVQTLPVWAFGFSEDTAQVGNGAKNYAVKLSKDSRNDRSTVTVSLASTILGTLPSAMNYLVEYPYGCVEQTTSRFVPAIIARKNSDLFAGALEGKDVNDIITSGLKRLSKLQRDDGGFTWWFSGESDPFITSYVIEYVLEAQQLGFPVEKSMLTRAQSYLEQDKIGQSASDSVSRIYGLSLLESNKGKKQITNFDKLTPDILSLAVLANYKNGDKNPATNGLSKLLALAKKDGNSVYWEAGDKKNFASTDASTAFAIRAITTTLSNREIAVSGAQYLLRSRRANYWSNTFATAQVVSAIVSLTRTGDELAPSYSYAVKLDGKDIRSGVVSSGRQLIPDIEILSKDIRTDGSVLSVSKNGDGQLYSSLLVRSFHTDKNAKAKNSGLSVQRQYINDKGEQYSLTVGDIVTVKITVSGLQTSQDYGVIRDELPAGLIPINQSFKNEQGLQNNSESSDEWYDISDREITQNGIILSLYQIPSGSTTYTYKARVISAGTFIVPPVRASLMYAPEIYGRGPVQSVSVTDEPTILPEKVIDQKKAKSGSEKWIWVVVIVSVLLLISTVLVFLKLLRLRPTS